MTFTVKDTYSFIHAPGVSWESIWIRPCECTVCPFRCRLIRYKCSTAGCLITVLLQKTVKSIRPIDQSTVKVGVDIWEHASKLAVPNIEMQGTCSHAYTICTVYMYLVCRKRTRWGCLEYVVKCIHVINCSVDSDEKFVLMDGRKHVPQT